MQEQIQTNPAPERSKPLYRTTQVVWYIFYIIEALLAIRFILKLIGANPGAGFTDFIYTVSAPFVAPFLYVVNPGDVGRSVFEWGTLIGMVVYWLIAWGIVKLVLMNKPVSSAEADAKLDQQEK